MNYLTELKRACDSSRIKKGAPVRLYRESMNSPNLGTVKPRLTLSPNDSTSHERIMKTYCKVLSHISTPCATDADIARADDKICRFEKDFWTPWDFSRNLWDITLRCGGLHQEQTLRGLFGEGIDLNIWSTMRRFWADNQEATVEDIAYKAPSLLDLQGGN